MLFRHYRAFVVIYALLGNIFTCQISWIFSGYSLVIGCMIQVSEVWGAAKSPGTFGNKVLNQIKREENKDNQTSDPMFLTIL